MMARVAEKYCDQIILTNEDPYDDDPKLILTQIKNGIMNKDFLNRKVLEIMDRREAIEKALSSAKPNDTVIITGKGSESVIHLAKRNKLAWSERQIVEDGLRKMEIKSRDNKPRIKRDKNR